MSDQSNKRATAPGRAMAIDLGEKRIGIAISDPGRLIASAHSVLKRRSRAEDFAHYTQLIEEQQINLIVMGLPITMAGHEGDRAAWVREYTTDFSHHIDVPIVYFDESLTTKQAEASLRAQGKRGRKIKEQVDSVAAAFILQGYLDSGRPPLEPDHDLA